jgi:hypothetical protein
METENLIIILIMVITKPVNLVMVFMEKIILSNLILPQVLIMIVMEMGDLIPILTSMVME